MTVAAPAQASGPSSRAAHPTITEHAVSTVVLWSLWALLSLAAAARLFGQGVDFPIYSEAFASLGTIVPFEQDRFELAYKAGEWLFKFYLGLPFGAFVAVGAGFAFAIKTRWLLKSDWPLLAWLAYFGTYWALHEYTQLRAAIALAFIIIAIDYYLKNRLFRAVTLIVIGSLFHQQVLLFIPALILFYAFRLHPVLGVVLVVTGLALLIANIQEIVFLVITEVSQLTVQLSSSATTKIGPLFRTVNAVQLFIMISSYVLPGAKRDTEQRLYIYFGLLGIVCYIMFREVLSLGLRLNEMFALFLIPCAFRGRANSPALLAGAFFALFNAAYTFVALAEQGAIG